MINIQPKPPIYDPDAVQPMRDELVYCGFEELSTPDKVEEVLSNKNDETVLVMVNSVCGCAAGSARPGVALSLQHETIPDRLTTVFAGMDRDSVDYIREKYLSQFPPSSPAIALFKNGEVVEMLHRHDVEGRHPEEISSFLTAIFDEHSDRKGPSISKEKYDKLVHAKMCGSKIPLNEE